MIKPQAISWFYENLPEFQIIEDKYKDIIRQNYNLSGFVSIDTPAVERLEVLTSKWADDNEIYALKRIHDDWTSDSDLWLRFDLTVPLARYISQYEWELTFPFRRQHIWRVYRWERPQKGRYREFYQADVDIIWNNKLALFADVEIISTIYSSLRELDFWEFVININNKKFLTWFLSSIDIKDISATISIIDKKDKIRKEKLKDMFLDIWLLESQIEEINKFIEFSEQNTSEEILSYYWTINNDTLLEWIKELKYLYDNLILLWVDNNFIKINSAISRWLNYYTGMVFETFVSWSESMWSISSWGRYENLASNFTKNNFPGVGGSKWLSRLLSVLNNLWRINAEQKTSTKVMLVNMWEEYLKDYLNIVNTLRSCKINTELYIDSTVKMQKQLKYANNKKIWFVIIAWEDEIKSWVVSLKNLETWSQEELKLENIIEKIKNS